MRSGRAAAVAVVCAAAAAALAVLVSTGASAGLDGPLSRAAVSAALEHPGPTRVAQVVEALTQPVWLYLLGALATAWCARAGRGRDALTALVTGAVAALLSPALKLLLARERPALEAGLTSAGGGSFPSGHAMSSATVVLIAVVLLLRPGALRRLVGVLGALLLLVVAVDRVWLGAHWPTDVLGGWLLAAALVGAAAWWRARSQRHGDGTGAPLRAVGGADADR
ncbi:phosphatase PAP2 family protein [Kineococcus sp. SYSU DK006]|uniref:phosphatase PAP2 family protein n=1 Tax=Kineococcus sp. SYSU DK006 TaxID=3383127 RepID=UPI003D7D9EBF